MVEQIARSLGTPVGELITNPQLLTKVDARQIDAGAFTVKDILEELRKPGRDPREQFVAPSFNEKVREFADDVRDGKFVLPVSRRMPLPQAGEAHALLERGGGGKIVLVIR